jgi:hypothetical protein
MYATDITECISCEQLIFPGEEVIETSEGLVCAACVDVSPVLATVSY